MSYSNSSARRRLAVSKRLSLEQLEERVVLSAVPLVELLQAGEFAPRDEAIGKIGFELASFASQFLRQDQLSRERDPEVRSDIADTAISDFTTIQDGGRIVIDAIAANAPADLVGDLTQLGLTEIAVAGRIVSGLLPLQSIARYNEH